MAKTPSVDDLIALLVAQNKRMDELERKVLSSIAVTDPTGVQMLSISPDTANSNRPLTILRDSNNNKLLSNDTVAGWGFAHPIMNYPMYPYDGLRGFSTNSTSYTGLLFTGINALSSKIQYSFDVTWNGSVSAVHVKFTYQPTGGTETIISELPFTGAGSGQQMAGSFLLPTNTYDSSTLFTVYAKVDTGSGSVAVVPNYLQTRGQNV